MLLFKFAYDLSVFLVIGIAFLLGILLVNKLFNHPWKTISNNISLRSFGSVSKGWASSRNTIPNHGPIGKTSVLKGFIGSKSKNEVNVGKEWQSKNNMGTVLYSKKDTEVS